MTDLDRITLQLDGLLDSDLKRMVITFASLAMDEEVTARHREFYRRLAGEVRAVVGRRERALAVLELDASDPHEAGGIVSAGGDPVADARDELWRAAEREAGGW